MGAAIARPNGPPRGPPNGPPNGLPKRIDRAAREPREKALARAAVMQLVALSPVHVASSPGGATRGAGCSRSSPRPRSTCSPGEMRLLAAGPDRSPARPALGGRPRPAACTRPPTWRRFKPRVDVTLVGHAFAPRGSRRARSWRAWSHRHRSTRRSRSTATARGHARRAGALHAHAAPLRARRRRARHRRTRGVPPARAPAQPRATRRRRPHPAHRLRPHRRRLAERGSALRQHAVFSPNEPFADGVDAGYFNSRRPISSSRPCAPTSSSTSRTCTPSTRAS